MQAYETITYTDYTESTKKHKGEVIIQAHTLTMTVIIGLVLIWAIVRQVLPRRVNRFPFIFLPIIGIFEAVQSLPQPVIPVSQLLEAAVAISISIVIGAWQAHVTTVYTESDGQVYMRGGWIYLLLWIFLFASRIVTDIVFPHPGKSFSSVTWIIWSELAVVWGVRGIVLYLKHPEVRAQLMRRKLR